ncbi:11712_t:CDS:2, partial [Funneliformis caledonium]
SHNLSEDCQTLASGLNKVESLNGKTIHDELTKCTNKGEFDSKKATLLMKADEAINGLRPRTGYSSSMFGISEEIKELTAEIRKIEAGMEEKKKKALDPNLSPQEKLAILEEIEEDGKLLQAKYEERNRLTNRFKHIDPSKHVSKLIERMRQAIERSNKGGGSGNGGGSGGNRRNPNSDPNNPFGNLPDGDGNSPGSIPNNTPYSRNPSQSGDNQQLILVALA